MQMMAAHKVGQLSKSFYRRKLIERICIHVEVNGRILPPKVPSQTALLTSAKSARRCRAKPSPSPSLSVRYNAKVP